MHETDEIMEELQVIKEKCSLARLARTPEEDRRHLDEVMKWAEEWLGRPIKTVDHTGRGRMRDEPVPAGSTPFVFPGP
jgi:hypothetical protein